MRREYVLRGLILAERPHAGKQDILIVEGTIAAIGCAGTLSSATVRECDGLWALPGCIDAHVHPIHNETFASAGHAAPFGGITTVLHHLYPNPGEPHAHAVQRAASESAEAPADFGFHLRITPGRIASDYGAIRELGIPSVKVFLAHSDPAVQCSLGELYEVMHGAARAGLLVLVHAEFGEVVARAERLGSPTGTLARFSAQRSPELEAAAVHAVTALAAATECRLYFPHISSAPALTEARRARMRGVQVLIETCPHYLFLINDAPLGGLGKVAPPLRTADDLAVLQRAVVAGDVDTVASDHCGYAQGQKHAGDIDDSRNGLPGLELLLPLLLDAALADTWIGFLNVVRVLASGPARAFGLTRKGAIAPGYDADLVLFDPQAEWTVRHEDLHDRSFYSPYEGRRLRGRIVQVIRRGDVLVRDGRGVGDTNGVFVTAPSGVQELREPSLYG